jgi:hypothetical protein
MLLAPAAKRKQPLALGAFIRCLRQQNRKKSLDGGERPVHQEEMSDPQKWPLLWEAEGLLVGPAGTSGGGSDVPIGDRQRASGISSCQQPKRRWHYVDAPTGSS